MKNTIELENTRRSTVPNSHQKPSHNLKKPSFKFLRPKPFLSLSLRNSQSGFQQATKKDFKPKQYCQKYFGKKVQYVQDSDGVNRALNSSEKLFQKVKLDKNVLIKDGFKATGDLVLVGKDVSIRKRLVLKALRGCKGKVTITLKTNTYEYTENEMYQMRQIGLLENPVVKNHGTWGMKCMRNCHPHLESLSLVLQSYEQIPRDRRIFEGLGSLKSFSLKFDQQLARWCGWTEHSPAKQNFRNYKDEYFAFFLRLIKEVPKLKTLRVDLAPYSMTSTPLAYLLLTLKYQNISNWYVRCGVISHDFMKIVNGVNIEEINKMAPSGLKSTLDVLKEVDFLAISTVNYNPTLGDECIDSTPDDYGSFRGSVLRLGEMPLVTCQHRKILDVSFPDFDLQGDLINLRDILSRFTSLEGVYIKAVENVVLFEKGAGAQGKSRKKTAKHSEWEAQEYGPKEETQHQLIIEDPKGLKTAGDELGWTRNLQKAYLSFLTMNFVSTVGDLIEFKQTNAFSNMMKVLKTQCPRLVTLNVFKGSPIFKGNGNIVWEKKTLLNVPCDEINGLNSLLELEVTTHDKGMRALPETLSSLKNLRRLKINVTNNDHLGGFDQLLREEYDDDMGYGDFDDEEEEFNEDEFNEEDFDEDDFDEDEGGHFGGRAGRGAQRGGFFKGRGVAIGGGSRNDKKNQGSNEELEKVLASIPRVQELELVIHPSKDTIDEPTKESVFKWAEEIAKAINGLRGLEVLKVVELKKQGISLDVLTKIIGGLSSKGRLREVVIDSEISKNSAALEFAAELMRDLSENVEDLAVRGLKAKLKQMIDSNHGLKRIDIRTFKGLKMNNISYEL